MSRKLMRVALDFDWPLNKIWKGYVNPYSEYYENCKECDHSGYSREGKFLNDAWYRHLAQDMFGTFYGQNILAAWDRDRILRAGWSKEVADNIDFARKFGFTVLANWNDKLDAHDVKALVEEGRLWNFTRTWTEKDGWKDKEPPYVPTPDEVNAWSGHGMGHDSINAGICIEARCKRHKVPHLCGKCKGEAIIWANAEMKKKSEEWEHKDPPKGDGFQLWENVTEGSPISPVFPTLDELCGWAADNATTFGREKATKEQWKKMLEEDNVHHKSGNMIFM